MIFFQLRVIRRFVTFAVRAALWVGVLGLLALFAATQEKMYLAAAFALALVTAFLFSGRRAASIGPEATLSSSVLLTAASMSKYAFAGCLLAPFVSFAPLFIGKLGYRKLIGALSGFFEAFAPYCNLYVCCLLAFFLLWAVLSLLAWLRSGEKFIPITVIAACVLFGSSMQLFINSFDKIVDFIGQVAGIEINWWHFFTQGEQTCLRIAGALHSAPDDIKPDYEKSLIANLFFAVTSLFLAFKFFAARAVTNKTVLWVARRIDRLINRWRRKRKTAVYPA